MAPAPPSTACTCGIKTWCDCTSPPEYRKPPGYESTSWWSTGTSSDNRDALVDRIAKTQADTHGVPEAWTSFIPEAEAIFTALFGAGPARCPSCGGRGWHTAGGNDPIECGRCASVAPESGGDSR